MLSPADAQGLTLLGRAAEVREMDRATIELGLPGRVLMELAGAGTARAIVERTGGRPGRAVVLCGGGNNGGDGYVIARHLSDHGWTVRCLATSDPTGLEGDAAANHALWVALGGEVRRVLWDTDEPGARGVTARMKNWLNHADCIVDALFGTGLTRDIEGPAALLLEWIEAQCTSHGLRVAVDLPSGVHADTGQVLGRALRCDLTATYGLPKPGLHLYPGRALAGEVVTIHIALPRAIIDRVGASARLATAAAVARWLPARPADSHKGTHGHLCVIGGLAGKEGAAVLTSLGALRAGAGLVTWLVDEGSRSVPRPPELMSRPVGAGFEPRSTVLLVGPGLGQDALAARLLEASLVDERPLVLDADGLNLLAQRLSPAVGPDAVLTPHPAEAARLLSSTVAEVQADRISAAEALVAATQATVILKGASSVVASHGQPAVVVPTGDPTLAAGGTGDVLAGVVAAFVAQGLAPFEAAVAGAYVHGLAGERAGAERAQRGALASEVADEVPGVVAELVAGWI